MEDFWDKTTTKTTTSSSSTTTTITTTTITTTTHQRTSSSSSPSTQFSTSFTNHRLVKKVFTNLYKWTKHWHKLWYLFTTFSQRLSSSQYLSPSSLRSSQRNTSFVWHTHHYCKVRSIPYLISLGAEILIMYRKNIFRTNAWFQYMKSNLFAIFRLI